MPQEKNINNIVHAGKFFEPEEILEQKPTPENKSTVKRKISVLPAFMEQSEENPFQKKVDILLEGIEPAFAKATAGKPASEETKMPDTENMESNGNCTVGPLEGEFDLKEFFSDDNKNVELDVWDSFKKKIAGASRKVSEQPPASLSSYTLNKAMLDSEIRAELPKNHVFALDDIWMIADLLKKQPIGGRGELLNNGKANLFYVQAGALVLGVFVYWDGSAWLVRAWELDESGQWSDGCHAFSRNG